MGEPKWSMALQPDVGEEEHQLVVPFEIEQVQPRRRSETSSERRSTLRVVIGAASRKTTNSTWLGETSDLCRRASIPEPAPLSLTVAVDILKESTLLAPEAKEELLEENPGVLVWLQSFTGLVAQAGLLVVFVGVDASVSLFTKEATKRCISQSLVLCGSIFSMAIALSLILKEHGVGGLRTAMDVGRMKRFAFAASLFAVADTFKTTSTSLLSPGTIKVLGQMRLPQCATISMFVLGRRYKSIQWVTMVVIGLGSIVFLMGMSAARTMRDFAAQVNKLETCHMLINRAVGDEQLPTALQVDQACVVQRQLENENTSLMSGVPLVFMYLLVSDMGCIITEKFLKEEHDTHFYVQKFAIDAAGMPISLLMLFLNPWILWTLSCDSERVEQQSVFENSIFTGWESWSVPAAVVMKVSQSWLTGLITKQMSSIVRLIGKVVSTAVVYFVGDCWLFRSAGMPPPLICTLSMFITLMSACIFMQIEPAKK